MQKKYWATAITCFALVKSLHAGYFADAVVNYSSGTNFSAGFTNASVALGGPTTNANPFSPAFRNTQLVSIGAGGSLTVHTAMPIVDNPMNPFGVDFIIYGNTGFVVTNGNFSGGGITDGSLLGNNTGTTKVEVSADGTNWFTLNQTLALTVDNIFPTDGIGNPSLPVNPNLHAPNFAGQGLAGIRALYNGAAGGTGYDLAWAQDTNGNYGVLSTANYVRITVLTGKSEVDAISVVPSLQETFASDPFADGWQIFGVTNLFQWNPTNKAIDVTWDSGQSNSYFYHPLGTVLNRDDDFSLAFDLQLKDIGPGPDPTKSFSFNIAVGLLNFAEATQTNFLRGTAYSSPDLCEFDYYFDSGFGATVWPLIVDTNSTFNYNNNTPPDYMIYSLTNGQLYHVFMNYTGSNRTMVTTVSSVGSNITITNPVAPSLGDFRVDTVSISSFNDDQGYGSSVLAHGSVANIAMTLPPPAVTSFAGGLSNDVWTAQFVSRTNWTYTLQRSANLKLWTDAATASGTGGPLQMQDNVSGAMLFYRVTAHR